MEASTAIFLISLLGVSLFYDIIVAPIFQLYKERKQIIKDQETINLVLLSVYIATVNNILTHYDTERIKFYTDLEKQLVDSYNESDDKKNISSWLNNDVKKKLQICFNEIFSLTPDKIEDCKQALKKTKLKGML